MNPQRSISCQICKQGYESVGELHLHYIGQHNPEELALALLASQNLLTTKAPDYDASVEDEILHRALAKYPAFLMAYLMPQRRKPGPKKNTTVKKPTPTPKTSTPGSRPRGRPPKQKPPLQKNEESEIHPPPMSENEILEDKLNKRIDSLSEEEKNQINSFLSNAANCTPLNSTSISNLATQSPHLYQALLNKKAEEEAMRLTGKKTKESKLDPFDDDDEMNEDSNDSMSSQPPVPKPLSVPQILAHAADRRYVCPWCPSAYKKKSHLDRHVRTHTGERPFECSVCSKRFAAKSVLQQHIRIHTGEKPFACSVCGARFKQTSGLMTHMMLHTGKPYKCDYCDKAYVSNHKLLKHMKTHNTSSPKQHTCNSCNICFFTLSALHQHQRLTHFNEKKFSCQICGAAFKLEVSLKVHLDNHVNDLGGSDDVLEKMAQVPSTSTAHEVQQNVM